MKLFQKAHLFTALLLVTLSALSVFTIGAVSEKRVSLSDVSTAKGQVCTFKLSAEGIEDICAFTAILEYDPKVLSFRGVKTESSGAETSAYCEANGRVDLVFLHKEGIAATDKTSLLSLEFMAESDRSSEVTIMITDALDSEGNVIKNILSESAEAKVSSSSSGTATEERKSNQQENSEEEENTEENTQDNSVGFLGLRGKGVGTAVIVFVAVSGLLLIAVVAFISYRVGMKKQRIRDFSANRFLARDILLERTKNESEEEK